jgi:outer membrane protein assembly factor BamE (lipoprotein component of BamABCDE complex)
MKRPATTLGPSKRPSHDNVRTLKVTHRRYRLFSPRARAIAAATVLSLSAAACNAIGDTRTHGFIIPNSALEQIPPGSSQEQVLVVLGTPSTTSTIGGDVYYYIQTTRHRTVAFAKERTIDQKVVAVYFNKNRQVERVANYGLKDGAVFDFVSSTTPTAGRELTFVSQILKAATGTPQIFN